MDITAVTKKEFSFNLIELLDTFFTDQRGYEFTLFCWPKKISHKNLIKNDIHFTWKVFDNKTLYSNGSASILFYENFFKSPFLGCASEKELSQMIASYIRTYYFEEKEFSSNFNMATGVSFFCQSWQDTAQKMFGMEEFKEFFAKKLSDKLSSELKEKEGREKLIKI